MPKKKINDIPTSGWISIDRDPHAVKAVKLRFKLQWKIQSKMKSTAISTSNEAKIITSNSKIVTNITTNDGTKCSKDSLLKVMTTTPDYNEQHQLKVKMTTGFLYSDGTVTEGIKSPTVRI
jgi:hypothetical protein